MQNPVGNTGCSESIPSPSNRERSRKDWNSEEEYWEWPVATGGIDHEDRLPLMRPIPYTLSVTGGQECQSETAPLIQHREGTALSMNVSSGGMLLIMNDGPEIESVLKVEVPSPVDGTDIPTLVEVRWSRKLPFPIPRAPHLVGVKFLI